MDLARLHADVSNPLLKQGRRSVNPKNDDACMYRGDNGLKCAAGFLIPDELYDRSLEYQNITDLLDEDFAAFSSNDGAQTPLAKFRREFIPSLEERYGKLASDDERRLLIRHIRKLQRIHDEAHPENWETELAEIAP